MSEVFDQETGEVAAAANGQGSTSERAAAAVSTSQMDRLWVPRGFGGNFIAINEAIFKTWKELPSWIKNQSDGNRGKYASFKDIIVTIKPVAEANDLHVSPSSESLRQLNDASGKGHVLPVSCLIVHIPTGGWKLTTIDMPAGRFDSQAVGSALTYGKRYSTLASFGIATDDSDDDGEATRKRDITKTVESTDVDDMREAIAALKDRAAMVKWRKDNDVVLQKLGEAEFERVKILFQDRQREIADADQSAGKKK